MVVEIGAFFGHANLQEGQIPRQCSISEGAPHLEMES